MNIISAPCVMVSSTYYDLRQIRTDLEQFIKSDLGYQPLLSEYSSFPVDPDKKTVENCKARVKEQADIMVLVIGGRYGHVDNRSKKSVTNLEYLSARIKGIPIYVFVDKKILVALPLWEKNPDGDFSSAVDNPQVFEFINEIRTKDKFWTFDFETAQDIIETLRLQLAHQMVQGLHLAQKLRVSPYSELLLSLSGKAFSLAVEQPSTWEYRLFAQVLSDEIDNCKELRCRFNDKLSLGKSENISLMDIQSWTNPRFHEIRRVVKALEYSLNISLQEAVGSPGQSGDVEHIVSVARFVGETYREALEWSLCIRRAAGQEEIEPVIDALALFPEDIIEKIESLGFPLLEKIEKALSAKTADNVPILNVNVSLKLAHTDEFDEAIKKLEDDLNSGKIELE